MNNQRLVALALVLLSCSAPAPSGLPVPVPIVSADEALQLPMANQLLASMLDVPTGHGVARVLHGKTACRARNGTNPMVWPGTAEPRVGRPVRVQWTTRACDPLTEEMAWVIVSYRKAVPIDFSPFNMPGCQWTVNADSAVAVMPGVQGLFRRAPGSGTIELEFVPPANMVGQSMFLMLLVAAHGENEAGWLVSPGLELIFGAQ